MSKCKDKCKCKKGFVCCDGLDDRLHAGGTIVTLDGVNYFYAPGAQGFTGVPTLVGPGVIQLTYAKKIVHANIVASVVAIFTGALVIPMTAQGPDPTLILEVRLFDAAGQPTGGIFNVRVGEMTIDCKPATAVDVPIPPPV